MPNVAIANRLANRIGRSAARRFPDVVTFKSTAITKSTSGGNIVGSVTNNSPTNVPVRYRPVSGAEIELAKKITSKAAYMLFVPAYFSSALISVDAKDSAVVAARSGGESAHTFTVETINRYEGLEIEILASLEE